MKILDTNLWDVAQTAEAKSVKLRKAEGVQRRKAERAAADTGAVPKYSGHTDGDAPTFSGHTERDASKSSEHALGDDD